MSDVNIDPRYVSDLESIIVKLNSQLDEAQEDNTQLLTQIDQKNTACGDALEKLWQDVMPEDYGDWEYPGQAYRHLLAEFHDLQVKLELERKLGDWAVSGSTAGSSEKVLKLLDLVNNLRIEKLELQQEVALLRTATTNLEYALVKEEELCNYVIEKTQTPLSRGKIKDMMATEKAERSK